MSLKDTLKQIEKDHGKGSIFKMDAGGLEVETISTGVPSLDRALGAGGLPRGRITEIYGWESTCKTTLALYLMAEAQRDSGLCAIVDAENALDPVYAQKRVGIDPGNLFISQPDNGEQGLEITETLIDSGEFDVVIVDSVAALVPRAEIEGDMGDSHMGLQARLMSQALRKITNKLGDTKTVCVFINQIRNKIGVVYGNPETTPGGVALKFYSSVRIELRNGSPIKDGDEFIGKKIKAKIVKNKVGPPMRTIEFDYMYDSAISIEGDLLDIAEEQGLIKRSGAWYAHGPTGENMGQGREAAKAWLADNPDVMSGLRSELLS